MLVHHADAGRDRLARTADAHRLAVDADLAGVGLVEAVDDVHQRRLAGAVLADDAVDDAARDDEIDVRLACTAPKRLSMPISSMAGTALAASVVTRFPGVPFSAPSSWRGGARAAPRREGP